jgi:hypothetical protein
VERVSVRDLKVGRSFRESDDASCRWVVTDYSEPFGKSEGFTLAVCVRPDTVVGTTRWFPNGQTVEPVPAGQFVDLDIPTTPVSRA